MKNLLFLCALLTSTASFAKSYVGEGVLTEDGDQVCAMEIVELENNKLDLTIVAAGLVVKSTVDKAHKIEFVTESEDLPSEEVNFTGIMSDNLTEPVSFQLITEGDGEMVECNF